MQVKLLEVRDRATFLPVLAVSTEANNAEQGYLLSRTGYGAPLVILTRLHADGRATHYDPYAWGDRTMKTAHEYISLHWETLEDGDVIDVEFILGETTEKKISERL